MVKFLILALASLFLVGVVSGRTWDTSNFPNPKRGDCIVKNNAYLCDPDMQISPSGREKVVKALNDLEKNTRNQTAGSYCDKQGITAAVAAGKEFKGTQKVGDFLYLFYLFSIVFLTKLLLSSKDEIGLSRPKKARAARNGFGPSRATFF